MPEMSSVSKSKLHLENLSYLKRKNPRLLATLKNDSCFTCDLGQLPSQPVPITTGGLIELKSIYHDKNNEQPEGVPLYVDQDFPPSNSSLYYSKKPPVGTTWLRPFDICDDPKFIVHGATRDDINQGNIGDCWLMAAIAACTATSKILLARVVPMWQSFHHDYHGQFSFNFYIYGEWTKITIDDCLPTVNGNLLFDRSKTKDEFWSSLLEKAYAKSEGSYEALDGGSMLTGMVRLTGGIGLSYNLKNVTPEFLWPVIQESHAHDSLMACAIPTDPSAKSPMLPSGLVMGHAYSITAIADVHGAQLLRIRNPWGRVEWKGRWSDNSKEWNKLSNEERKRLGLVRVDDGEFWMCLEDYMTNFRMMDICHLNPSCFDGTCSDKAKWTCSLVHGRWKNGFSAGGCPNYPETFWTNPQYHFQVYGDPSEDSETGPVIIGLMQVERRGQRDAGHRLRPIGFVIYKISSKEEDTRSLEFFLRHRPCATSEYQSLPEVTGRFLLQPGWYLIIPSTFYPSQQESFALRIFSHKPHSNVECHPGHEMIEIPEGPKLQTLNDKQIKTLSNEFDMCKGQLHYEQLKVLLNKVFTKDNGWCKCGSSKSKYLSSHGTKFEGFTLSCSRSLLAMINIEQSGVMDKNAFLELMQLLNQWKSVYAEFVDKQSGVMKSYMLPNAVGALGWKIDREVVGEVAAHFARMDETLPLNEFVRACSHLKLLDEIAHGLTEGIKMKSDFTKAEIMTYFARL